LKKEKVVTYGGGVGPDDRNPYIKAIKYDDSKENEDDEVRDAELYDWLDLKKIYDLLLETNKRYSKVLSAPVRIKKESTF
jgi:hypothetical protein